MTEEEIIEDEQEKEIYPLEWLVTFFLAGLFLFFIVKFLFF